MSLVADKSRYASKPTGLRAAVNIGNRSNMMAYVKTAKAVALNKNFLVGEILMTKENNKIKSTKIIILKYSPNRVPPSRMRI